MTSAFARVALKRTGFQGFETVANLRMDRCASVPRAPGAYVVLRDVRLPNKWLRKSPGGWFKGRDPTVAEAVLDSHWIASSEVVYIGKADLLQRRLRQYLDFGAGKPVGHWGGRLIWQLSGSENLEFAWVADEAPQLREAALLQAFVDEFGVMPFANLRR